MPELPHIVRERLKVSRPTAAHPDADLLTAFAERALPESERAVVAEHLARCHDMVPPEWSEQYGRKLKRPYFAGGLESLKARLTVESPAAFRRRLLFVSKNALSRPRIPHDAAAP